MKRILSILASGILICWLPVKGNMEKAPSLFPIQNSFFETVLFSLITEPTAPVDLKPKPVTIVVAPGVDPSKDLKARDVKKELSDDVLDSILHAISTNRDFPSDSIQWKIYTRSFFGDSIPPGERLAWLKANHPHDVIAFVTMVEAKIEKDATDVSYDSDGKKTKTQRFYMAVDARVELHSAKGLLKTLTPSGTTYLEDRTVMSGLLSAGPALSSNAAYAFQAAPLLAKGFMMNFYPQTFQHYVYIDLKKEWRPMYQFYQQEDYDKAIEEINQQMALSPKEPILGRLYFLRSLCWFNMGDYDNAITDAQDADRYWASGRSSDWRQFLMKYTVENEILW